MLVCLTIYLFRLKINHNWSYKIVLYYSFSLHISNLILFYFFKFPQNDTDSKPGPSRKERIFNMDVCGKVLNWTPLTEKKV